MVVSSDAAEVQRVRVASRPELEIVFWFELAESVTFRHANLADLLARPHFSPSSKYPTEL